MKIQIEEFRPGFTKILLTRDEALYRLHIDLTNGEACQLLEALITYFVAINECNSEQENKE